MRTHLVLLLVVAVLSPALATGPQRALAATFYVDPEVGSMDNDGSEARPWRTLQEVFENRLIESQSSTGGPVNPGAPVKAGDTILLRSGYHGELVAGNYCNADLITVIAQQGHRPTLRRLVVNGFRNWRFAGLEISTEISPAFDRYTSGLVSITACNTLTLENCLVYSVTDVSTFTAEDWIAKASWGIVVDASQKVSLLDNVVRNTSFAMVISAPQTLIRGNQIVNYSADGIRSLADDITIEYNVIKNAFKVDSNHDDGIQVFKPNTSQGLIRNMIIRGNTIIDNEDPNQPLPSSPQGIGIFEGPHENFRIENNLVITNTYHGITIYWGRNCTIINNTVINPKFLTGASTVPAWIAIEQAKPDWGGEFSRDCRIANNIANAFRTGGNINLTFENNLVVTPDNYAALFADAAAADYRLKPTAPAVDTGSAVDAPTLDLLQKVRPANAGWDIGCYELPTQAIPPQPPVALAGHVTVFDADSSGRETVTLDGSASYCPGGSIAGWSWRKDGLEIATGAVAQVDLPVGRHEVTLTVTSSADPPLTDSTVSHVTVSPTPVVASAELWQNFPAEMPDGSFAVSFDIQPTADAIDAAYGLSAASVTSYKQLSCVLRFNLRGLIDVYNGTGYMADTVLPYKAGKWYHVSMYVDLPSRRYSVFVTPEGGETLPLAIDYAFRADAAALANWAIVHIGAGGLNHKDQAVSLDLPPLVVTEWSAVFDHGIAGEFICDLPENHIEPRIDGIRCLRIGFNQNIDPATLADGAIRISSSSGQDFSNLIQSTTLSSSRRQAIVTLSQSPPDGQTCTFVATTAIRAEDGRTLLAQTGRTLRILAGDVDASGAVTAADVLAVRAAVGDPLGLHNLNLNVTGTGTLGPGDMRAIRARIGRSLP